MKCEVKSTQVLSFVIFVVSYSFLVVQNCCDQLQITMTSSYHSHAPWRKAILIPFWTLQLGFELLMIGLLALSVGYLSNYVNDSSYSEVVDDDGNIYDVDTHALNNAEHKYETSLNFGPRDIS